MKCTFLAGVVFENNIYFSSWLSNGLYRLNIVDGSCELVTIFVEEQNRVGLHSYACVYKDKICFIPCYAQKIAIFDIKTNCVEYKDLPDEGRVILDASGNTTFKFVCFNNNNSPICWLIPVGYNLLIKLNIESAELEIIKGLPSELKWEDGTINFLCGCIKKNVIHIMPYEAKGKMAINILENTIKYMSLGSDSSKYRIAIPYNDELICVPHNIGEGIKIYSDTGTLKKEIAIEGFTEEKNIYLTYGYRENSLILFPFLGKEEIHIDLKTYDTELFPIQSGVKNEIGFFQRCLEINGDMYVISDRLNNILKIGKNGKRNVIEIMVDEEQYYDVWTDIYDKHPEEISFFNARIPRGQEEVFRLKHFIKYIRKNKNEVDDNKEESIGLKVMKALKG